MKTEFLSELGLEKEVIDKIMAENGKDVEAVRSKLTDKLGELDTATKTIQDLQSAVSKFDGVDPGKLKSDLEAMQQKYEADTAALRLNNALDLALVGHKARDPKLTRAALNLEAIKLDGDKLLGLDDQLTALKKDKAFLFEETETKPKVTTGLPHGEELDPGDAFVAAARKGAGLSEKGE